MRLLKQSQTAQVLCFLMVDSTDHVSAKTGLSPTVTLSKNGAAFASPAGAVSEIANGWYKVAGNATDTNTLGPLILHASAAGADPVDVEFEVVSYDPQDAVRLGLSALPNANAGANGGLPTGDASGRVTVGSVATDALTAAALAADAVAEIQSGLATAANLAIVAAYVDTEVAAIKAVTDLLTAAQAEPTTVPAANATPLQKIAWLFTLARNKRTQTTTLETVLADDGATTIATSTKSDTGGVFTRGKYS